ncbi:MAG: hypothetical protein IJW97_04260 [Clostridia bacterium]|nr:hypothetical protein [Clostridia bacterium]
MYRRSKIKTEELCEDASAIARAEGFLNGYQMAAETLGLLEAERNDRASGMMSRFSASLRAEQIRYWRARARDVCALIDAIAPSTEKMMLHYYYILGYTVEAASEAMDISLRTAFRIKKRALALAASALLNGGWSVQPPPLIAAEQT